MSEGVTVIMRASRCGHHYDEPCRSCRATLECTNAEMDRLRDLSARIIARADQVLALPVSDTFADGFREAWREARLMARGE